MFAGKNQKVPVGGQQPEEELTEEELARYVQELQKHQVRTESLCPESVLEISPC